MTASVARGHPLRLVDGCARAARDPRAGPHADLADARDRLVGSIVGAVVGKSISNDNGVVISSSHSASQCARCRLPQVRAAAAHLRAWCTRVSRAWARVEQTRERLQSSARPQRVATRSGKLEQARLEAMLRELHRAGVLTDDEFADKLAGLHDAHGRGF